MKNKIKINQICRYCGKRCVKSTTDEILYDVIYSLKSPFEIEEKLKYHKSCAVKHHRQKAIIKRETEQNLLNKPHVIKSLPSELHECPICKQKTGKTYIIARLPTICQNCDHVWLRG